MALAGLHAMELAGADHDRVAVGHRVHAILDREAPLAAVNVGDFQAIVVARCEEVFVAELEEMDAQGALGGELDVEAPEGRE